MKSLPDEPTPAQRAWMERAHGAAERDRVKPPRRLLPQVVGVVLALSVVATVLLGFDRFLTAVQKTLHTLQEQDKAEAERKAKEPVPAYVVPEDAASGEASPPSPPQR